MTQTELGEYMMDIQSEIEDSYYNLLCSVKEKTNRYGNGWTINISNIIESEKFHKGIDLIINRIDILFELDLDLKILSGLMGDRSHVYTDWTHMKSDLRDYRDWQSIEITIGKSLRKIKKFENFLS